MIDDSLIYVLMEDSDMTMRSSPGPVGYAVSSEEEAKKWCNDGQFRCFRSVVIRDAAADVDRERRAESDRRRAEFDAKMGQRECLRKEEQKDRLERDAGLISGRSLPVVSPQEEVGLADLLLSQGKDGCALTSLEDDKESVEGLDAGLRLSKGTQDREGLPRR